MRVIVCGRGTEPAGGRAVRTGCVKPQGIGSQACRRRKRKAEREMRERGNGEGGHFAAKKLVSFLPFHPPPLTVSQDRRRPVQCDAWLLRANGVAICQEAHGRGQDRPRTQLRRPGAGRGGGISMPSRTLVWPYIVFCAPGASVQAPGGGLSAGVLGGGGAAVLRGAELHGACKPSRRNQVRHSHVRRPPAQP